MHCGIADSSSCPVVVELEAFAALDLRVRDRMAVRALIVIVFASSWSYHYNFGGLTSDRYILSLPLLLLTFCKLHTVVQVMGLSQHHQLVGGVSVMTCVGREDGLRCRP